MRLNETPFKGPFKVAELTTFKGGDPSKEVTLNGSFYKVATFLKLQLLLKDRHKDLF